jgi:anti-sigma B factor antagonist
MAMTLEKHNSIPEALGSDVSIASQCIRPLKVTVNRMFGRVHIVLVGELDDSTAPLLRQTFQDEILPDPGEEVVLDIGVVSFIDSTGLNLFLSFHKDLIMQGSKLIIYSPSTMARRLFDITRLSEVLVIEG